MESNRRIADRDQLVRGVLTVVLTAAAIRSIRKGKRLRGALTGGGALLLGYTVVTGTVRTPESFELEPERPRASADLHCASCGQPIRLGQRRGPNAKDQIVHADCAEA